MRPGTSFVGRDEQLLALSTFVSGAGPTSAMVLVGAPGIGKTTLWQRGLDDARAQGVQVLSSRPAEFEQGMPYAGLGDLLAGDVEELLSQLVAPRRHALEVALLRREPAGRPEDARAVSLGVCDTFELLAREAPVLVAVDDVQWLDGSTARALAFARRRTSTARVRYLLTRRVDDVPAPRGSSAVDFALDVGAERMALGPLSVGAMHRILHDELGHSLSRQTLLRVHEMSGGNPFIALQVARLLDGAVDPLSALPVPADLDAMVRTRVEALPPGARTALALVAAAGAPTEGLLERVRASRKGVDLAVDLGLLEHQRDVVRFTHPWFASAVYGSLTPRAREALHRRLAASVDDPLTRARHLAHSQPGPDEGVANTLEEAVPIATARAAPGLAAELAELSWRMTPVARASTRDRRALRAAETQQAAGEWPRARQILEELLQTSPGGSTRAQALVILAGLSSVENSIRFLEQALEAARGNLRVTGEVLVELGMATRFRTGFATAAELVKGADDIAKRLGDDRLRVRASSALAWLEANAGLPDAQSHAREAGTVAGTVHDEPARRVALVAETTCMEANEGYEECRAIWEEEYREWQDRDEPWLVEVMKELAFINLSAGRWREAADYDRRARELGVQYGIEKPQDLLATAMILLYQGDLDAAIDTSSRGLSLAEEQFGLHPPAHVAVIGVARVWQGDLENGAGLLDQASRQAATLQWGAPANRWWVPELVDVLTTFGRLPEAVEHLEVWEADGRRMRARRVLANARRCRGLIAAADGDIREALGLLEESQQALDELGDHFGAARALLSLGMVRRRARQPGAPQAFAEARNRFQKLGAATWVQRVADEHQRLSGRRRVAGLTDAQRRVTELVVEGRSNKEIAAALFLSERTVTSHLTKIYAKLDVRSRTQLIRALR